MDEIKKMDAADLEEVSGGRHYGAVSDNDSISKKDHHRGGSTRTVAGLQTGYLAIRTQPAYDDSNIIGRLYNGDKVEITGGHSGNGYVWIYAPSCGKSGWVNQNFIK
ncbi:MAG: SH3 domain-containing protein [Eubacteriales bacterium]|nr:SH3 domain-containing protein [Eubacteriales bacterium]